MITSKEVDEFEFASDQLGLKNWAEKIALAIQLNGCVTAKDICLIIGPFEKAKGQNVVTSRLSALFHPDNDNRAFVRFKKKPVGGTQIEYHYMLRPELTKDTHFEIIRVLSGDWLTSQEFQAELTEEPSVIPESAPPKSIDWAPSPAMIILKRIVSDTQELDTTLRNYRTCCPLCGRSIQ